MTMTVLRLYGPRATGVLVHGTLHHDEGTYFSVLWYEDEDDAISDIYQTAQLCGADPQQHFALIHVDVPLPGWWEILPEELQAQVIEFLTENLAEYPPGFVEERTWTGDQAAASGQEE
jgi:hypothetical protein